MSITRKCWEQPSIQGALTCYTHDRRAVRPIGSGDVVRWDQSALDMRSCESDSQLDERRGDEEYNTITIVMLPMVLYCKSSRFSSIFYRKQYYSYR